MSPDTLQWMGCVTGVIGSLLLATRIKSSGWGFVLFLLSNFFWMGYGAKTNATGLIVMQSIFAITSMIGIYRWFDLKKWAPAYFRMRNHTNNK